MYTTDNVECYVMEYVCGVVVATRMTYPVNTKHLYNIYTTSAQRLRRRADVV